MGRSCSFLVLAAFLSGACAAHQVELQDIPSEIFVGHLTADTTGSWFTPCGAVPGAAKWWVTFTGVSVQKAERAKTSGLLAAGERTFVRVSAARTDQGQIGPGGPALLVRDIAEVRASGADDCPAGSSR